MRSWIGVQKGEKTSTSSPGSTTDWKAPNSPCIPPLRTTTSSSRAGDAVALAQLRGDGRAQLGDAGRRRVARPVLGERARHRLLDGLGRVEEGLAALELEDRSRRRARSSMTLLRILTMSENPTPSRRRARRKTEADVDTIVRLNLRMVLGEQARIIAPGLTGASNCVSTSRIMRRDAQRA